ncbi:hypothetical protein FSP39_017876 [Pinctada imbricata]|uniref:Uncharacterized protein n=1 Tax=Pinctada imbricata TaxID=66713 RepID=A0AA89C3R5_PINIB|nr:hypothetical protein FSP39_017876 [Pinctada imbricata]
MGKRKKKLKKKSDYKRQKQNLTSSGTSGPANTTSDSVTDKSSSSSSIMSSILGAAHSVFYGTSTNTQTPTPPTPPVTSSTPNPPCISGSGSGSHFSFDDEEIKQQFLDTNVKLDEILAKLSKLDVIESKILQLEDSVGSLNRRVSDIETKSTDLENSVQFLSNTLDENRDKLNDLKDVRSLKSVKVDITRHENNMEYINRALDNMRRKNKELEENITDLRWRSMKNNLIFNGLPENRQENVVEHLRYFLDRQLGITKSISFGNVHRFGRAMRGRPRPIVARFLFQDERELVLSNARMLRGTDFGIREQYPREIEEKRKQLYPIERDFRRDGARTKMVRDKLYVDGRLYIPEDDEEWYDYNDWRDRENLMDTDTCTAPKSGMSQNNQGAYGQALIHTTPIVSSPVSQPVVVSSSAILHTTHVVGSPGPHTSAAAPQP